MDLQKMHWSLYRKISNSTKANIKSRARLLWLCQEGEFIVQGEVWKNPLVGDFKCITSHNVHWLWVSHKVPSWAKHSASWLIWTPRVKVIMQYIFWWHQKLPVSMLGGWLQLAAKRHWTHWWQNGNIWTTKSG